MKMALQDDRNDRALCILDELVEVALCLSQVSAGLPQESLSTFAAVAAHPSLL